MGSKRKARREAKVRAKAEAKRTRKPRKSTLAARKFGSLALAAYIPGFIRIHWRYFRNNIRTWAALFVAPFLAVKLSLTTLVNRFAADGEGAWSFDLIAIFLIGLFFFLAERNRDFRQFYVHAAPAVMALGLLHWAGDNGGYFNAGYFVKLLLIGIFSYRVWQFTITEGYQQLTEGADKEYRTGRLHYDRKEYDLAMPLLEKAAKRGHFKSIFMIGQAYEFGHYYDANKVTAATYYLKASKKGYGKAGESYKRILETLSESEKTMIEERLF